MDKRDLRSEYHAICKILGFTVPECDEYLKTFQDKDDYKLGLMSPIKDDRQAQEIFMEAYLTYIREPDKYRDIYE